MKILTHIQGPDGLCSRCGAPIPPCNLEAKEGNHVGVIQLESFESPPQAYLLLNPTNDTNQPCTPQNRRN